MVTNKVVVNKDLKRKVSIFQRQKYDEFLDGKQDYGRHSLCYFFAWLSQKENVKVQTKKSSALAKDFQK